MVPAKEEAVACWQSFDVDRNRRPFQSRGLPTFARLQKVPDLTREFGKLAIRIASFGCVEWFCIAWQHLQALQPTMLVPDAIANQDRENLKVASIPSLQEIGDFFVHAERRGQEIRRNQTDRDLGFLQGLMNALVPLDASLDLPVIPNGKEAKPIEILQLRQQLILPRLVSVAVADKDRRGLFGLDDCSKCSGHRLNTR